MLKMSWNCSVWMTLLMALACFGCVGRNVVSAAYAPFLRAPQVSCRDTAFVGVGPHREGRPTSNNVLASPFVQSYGRYSPTATTTQLYGVRDFLRNRRGKQTGAQDATEQPETTNATPEGIFLGRSVEDVDVCVIGAGVSGLVAAITAANETDTGAKIVVLEGSATVGGRVQSDSTTDGYVLDRGFAVFIEEYPAAKILLNYTTLALGKFQPGALVKLKGETSLARVADPLRQPWTIFEGIVAPVGTLLDKIKVLPLIYHVMSQSIEQLFDEPETDTLTCLKERWGFSDAIVDRFFKPFLEGIYLAPLEEQSSRMFHFVFKMFSEGAATLPKGGIGEVAAQLEKQALDKGVEIRTGQPVGAIVTDDNNEERIRVNLRDERRTIRARSVILATEGPAARDLLGGMEALRSLETVEQNPQREVGCLYYGFNTTVPVSDPILVLSGYCEDRGSEASPINNICFPSVVSEGYAPEGCNLCSVTVLKGAMKAYDGQIDDLDQAVRKELCDWFPLEKDNIQDKWELKGTYHIRNAQPAQMGNPTSANINGGRDCTSFGGKNLPDGLLVCGDHMATATLNGALESGANAGREAAKVVQEVAKIDG